MKKKSSLRAIIGLAAGVIFMLLLNCNVFANDETEFFCLEPISVTETTATLKWQEPPAGLCNIGMDRNEYDYYLFWYRGQFGGQWDTTVFDLKAQLLPPNSDTLLFTNLQPGWYYDFAIGVLKKGEVLTQYWEGTRRDLGGCSIYTPCNIEFQAIEEVSNITETSAQIFVNRLSGYGEGSKNVYQYTEKNTFSPLMPSNMGDQTLIMECGIFYDSQIEDEITSAESWTRLEANPSLALYKMKPVLLNNLKPNTNYKVRVIDILGTSVSCNLLSSKYYYDYENIRQIVSFTTKAAPTLTPTLTPIPTVTPSVPAQNTDNGKITEVKAVSGNSAKEKVKLSWKSQKQYSGYQVEVTSCANNKKTTVTLKNTVCTAWLSKVNPKAFYKVRVRGILNLNTKTYSAWSPYAYINVQEGSKDVKVQQNGKKIKITWKKVAGASNYTVYVSASAKGKYQKVKTTSKLSYTMVKYNGKNLKKKKTYYIKVAANKKVGSMTYTSTQNTYFKIRVK